MDVAPFNLYHVNTYGAQVMREAVLYAHCKLEYCTHLDYQGTQKCPIDTMSLLCGMLSVDGVVKDVLQEHVRLNDVVVAMEDSERRQQEFSGPVYPAECSLGRGLTSTCADIIAVHAWISLFEYQGYRDMFLRVLSPEFMLLGIIRHIDNNAVWVMCTDIYNVRRALLDVMSTYEVLASQ